MSLSVNNKPIGGIGLGLMRLTVAAQVTPDEQAFAVLKKSLEAGTNMWNSGEFYGQPGKPHLNLELLNRYFTKHPEDASRVVLSVKGAFDISTHTADCSPAGIRKSIDSILSLLGPHKVPLDLFECARVDPNVPIETTIKAIVEYIDAGKVGGICLSECSADTIRRAAKVHKISGVEVEYSLFATDIRDNGVLDACHELDIPIIAYSPVGWGFLTGQIKRIEDFPENDHRRHFDRFLPGNFEKNIELVDHVERMAKKKGVTNAQLALGWLKAQKEVTVIPIPGTTNVERVVENSTEVKLTEEEMEELEQILKDFKPTGVRYMNAKGQQEKLFADSKPL